jgi:hypothetical protein
MAAPVGSDVDACEEEDCDWAGGGMSEGKLWDGGMKEAVEVLHGESRMGEKRSLYNFVGNHGYLGFL